MNRRDSGRAGARGSGSGEVAPGSGHHGSHGGGHGGHDDGHPPSSVGPKATRIILGAFFLISAGLLVADFFVDRYIEHPWENLKGFYPLWGLFGVAGLILAAKGLRRIVMRSEDYYDAD